MKLLHNSRSMSYECLRKPEKYISGWKADRCISFRGPGRGTGYESLTIEIDDSDVVALFNALIEDLKERHTKQVDKLRFMLNMGALTEELKRVLDEDVM